MNHNYAVILAGGKGERFWPLSTSQHPKQVLSLVGDKPLLAQARDRLVKLMPAENIYIITSADLVAVTAQAVPDLPLANIIGEPMGRDTAAAIALGAALIQARDPEGRFCVLTADHIIGQLDLFGATLEKSLELAAQDYLITIGIVPNEPSTGYGYIECGEALKKDGPLEFFRAKRFVEKPDLAHAEEYLRSGRYFWNSGMFVWSAQNIITAFRKHRPPLAEMIARLIPQTGRPDFMDCVRKEYEQLQKISIDYAVMEKADNVVMVKGIFAWDDVGAWPALERHFAPDAHGNVCIGDVQGLNAGGNIVYSKDRLTALIGVDNLVVVQADGVTLICPKDKAQDVKKMVEQIKATKRFDQLL